MISSIAALGWRSLAESESASPRYQAMATVAAFTFVGTKVNEVPRTFIYTKKDRNACKFGAKSRI